MAVVATVAEAMAGAVSTAAEGEVSTVVAQHFTVAVSAAAARLFMAEVSAGVVVRHFTAVAFAARMLSTAAAFGTADTGLRMATAFTGATSTGMSTTRRPIITRTATAG
jgi:hypothetical protein